MTAQCPHPRSLLATGDVQFVDITMTPLFVASECGGSVAAQDTASACGSTAVRVL